MTKKRKAQREKMRLRIWKLTAWERSAAFELVYHQAVGSYGDSYSADRALRALEFSDEEKEALGFDGKTRVALPPGQRFDIKLKDPHARALVQKVVREHSNWPGIGGKRELVRNLFLALDIEVPPDPWDEDEFDVEWVDELGDEEE